MKDKIKKDRRLLLIFFLIWLVVSLLAAPMEKQILNRPDFDAAVLVAFLLVFIMHLITVLISSIYIYRMYKWYNSPKAPTKVITSVYFLSGLFLPIIAIIICIAILWKSRKLLKDEQNNSYPQSKGAV